MSVDQLLWHAGSRNQLHPLHACSKSYDPLRLAGGGSYGFTAFVSPRSLEGCVLLNYVDEAGNDQLLDRPDAPPVLAVAGLTIAENKLKPLVWDFIGLKKEFNPQIAKGRLSEVIKYEVKGADLRADLRSDSRRARRRAQSMVDNVLTLVETMNGTITGCVCVKADGMGIPRFYYADSIARIAADFHAQLAAASTPGLLILDAQTKSKNTPNVHGITTRKFKTGGDPMPLLLESPVFGHSDAHVALQIIDIVVSTLIFPMACRAYCRNATDNTHSTEAYDGIAHRWGARLQRLEHRYLDHTGERRGGIAVRNDRGTGSSVDLFRCRLESCEEHRRQRLRNGAPSDLRERRIRL